MKSLVQEFASAVEELEHKGLTKDSKNMLEVLPAMIALQNEKGALYGRSYCKHGEFSIFFNVERKWDRLSNIMEQMMKTGTDRVNSLQTSTTTETFLDTVVDLAIYSVMWVGWVKENYPERWEEFLETNSKFLSTRQVGGDNE